MHREETMRYEKELLGRVIITKTSKEREKEILELRREKNKNKEGH